MKFTKCSGLRGEVIVPGDKSISHRSVMFGAIAKGTTEVRHYLQGADCLSTISCFQKMGIDITNNGGTVLIHGKGLRGLSRPAGVLDCGNSGTTTRLISGILSAQDFDVTLSGDASIQKRPMKRIIDPLSKMGAQITSLNGNGCAPLRISGRKLHGISYTSQVASAQVKSAILLAGLYADGETRVTEPYLSRNHSEIMLRYFGADVRTEPARKAPAAGITVRPAREALTAPGRSNQAGVTAVIQPADELTGNLIEVPGDISSAAFFLCAGLMIPHSEILLRNVGINPTRAGILAVAKDMGGDISLLNTNGASPALSSHGNTIGASPALRSRGNESAGSGEPTADILVRSSALHGTVIEGAAIPTLIDELPMIAAMACFAEGTTVIRDAAELKVKESNRIAVMTENLTAMGADVTETADGMIIRGGKPLHGAVVDSHLDHRIAMTFAVAGLCAEGETEIRGAECVNISYPQFYEDLTRLMR